jgi:DNA-binding SARP family transcriptional activator
VMERLMSLREQEGDYAGAILVAQRLLRVDPLREVVYRHLMDLYVASDNRVAAVRVYQTCAKVLERELGVRPSATTRALYERIVRSDELLMLRSIS